jgi:tetratricopeptide (TPR) repeat protein
VVQRLGKPWYRRRALRVFRDDTSLSATPTLWPSIEQALGQSRYLILLAAPDSARSHWVGKEVTYWLEHKGIDTLLVALTDGELVWDESAGDFRWSAETPLPPCLKGRFTAEPKWIDARHYRDNPQPRDAKFTDIAADFAAAIHGIPKEDLLSEEVRQQRRSLMLAWAAALALLIFAGAATWQWRDATEQKVVAQTQRDRAERNFRIAQKSADDVVFKLAHGLRDVHGMRVESVRQVLETAQTMVDQLARTEPDDPALQGSRGVMLNEFSATYLAAGDVARARSAADEALTITRKLAALDPKNVDWLVNLNSSLQRVAEVRLAGGDLPGAVRMYEESLAISRQLSAAAPGAPDLLRNVGAGLSRLGDLRLAMGDIKGAAAAIEESLAIMRRLVALNPDVAELQRRIPEWQRSLGVVLGQLGDVRLAEGDQAGAAAAFDESLAIARKLAADDPGNADLQRQVFISLNSVGNLRSVAGDWTGALAAYEEGLALIRKIAASDPANTGWQRDVGLAIIKVGTVRLETGDNDGALAAFVEGNAIARRLAGSDSANTEWQRDLGSSLLMIGRVRLAAGNRLGAVAVDEEAVEIFRKLAAADPDNLRAQVELIMNLYAVSEATSDRARARQVLTEALAMAEVLARDGKLEGDLKDMPDELRQALAKLPPEGTEPR